MSILALRRRRRSKRSKKTIPATYPHQFQRDRDFAGSKVVINTKIRPLSWISSRYMWQMMPKLGGITQTGQYRRGSCGSRHIDRGGASGTHLRTGAERKLLRRSEVEPHIIQADPTAFPVILALVTRPRIWRGFDSVLYTFRYSTIEATSSARRGRSIASNLESHRLASDSEVSLLESIYQRSSKFRAAMDVRILTKRAFVVWQFSLVARTFFHSARRGSSTASKLKSQPSVE